jgi:large subunit ribosomal protein L10e
MALRKASSYSKKKVRPYTRKSAKRKKAFIKTIPQNKIVKFHMGKKGKHKFIVKLVTNEKIQIRDNALESCRMTINKTMDKEVPGLYLFTVKVFPHHILRENKIAAGAGADRLSSGMRHSFGVTTGRAAIVNKGKEVFTISCANEKAVKAARAALTKVKPKIPCKSKIILEKI